SPRGSGRPPIRGQTGGGHMPGLDDIDQAVAGLTIPKLFLRQVEARPDDPAIKWREGDGWGEWTWQEYADEVARLAAGLARLGLRRGDRAVLMMRNVPEFYATDLALTFLGVCSISIY